MTVPIFILTGFLGSGKTSLLNRLLTERLPGPGRLAIIVNEFGDIGIDGDLLPSDATRQVELPGGCVCCLMNEDLESTVLQLLEEQRDLETIILETTGIAEPLPISWSIGREPLSDCTRLAAVVTVVDAQMHAHNRTLSPAVDAQVSYADVVVVSKLDLAPNRVDQVIESVRQCNASVPILTCGEEEIASALWMYLADPPIAERAVHLVGDCDHDSHGNDVHEPGRDGISACHRGVFQVVHDFESVSFELNNVFDFEELSESLSSLPAAYVRIKGIARVVDASTGSTEPRLIAFHRVGTRVSYEVTAAKTRPRVVAIGVGIDRARLAACFTAAVLT